MDFVELEPRKGEARETAQLVTVYHTPNGCALSYRIYTFYRRKAIYYKVCEDLISIIRQLCLYKGGEIMAYDARSCSYARVDTTQRALPDLMGYLKSKSALMIVDKHANLNNE